MLEERYPNLAFLLRIEGGSLPPFDLHGQDIDREVGALFSSLKVEEFEVIYIYGLGLGYTYFPFKQWLKNNCERDLIFIEENLGVLKAFLEMGHAEEILKHPQVHIRFNLDKKRLDPFLEECAETFPVQKIGVTALASYKKHYRSRYYQLREKLHRKTTVRHALFHENQYYPLFFKNFIPNFYRLEKSFDGNGFKDLFKDIPAIICGAGPSLNHDLDLLRQLEERALIFAGGSAITALTSQGVRPHFGVAYDPNDEELKRFMAASAFELPLLYATRLHAGIFNTLNGKTGYLHSETGGMGEYWMENELGLEQHPLKSGLTMEAISVTAATLPLACLYGCNPIILLGVDLAFTNNQIYGSGVVPSPSTSFKDRKGESRTSEKLLNRTDIYGRPIKTLIKWVMESATISAFAKHNPDFTFINATSGGLGFKQIPHRPLSSIPLNTSYDLYGMVHHAIETHPLPIPPGKVDEKLLKLKASLEKANEYVSIALEELDCVKGKDPETGRLIFAQMELETLDAYTALLESHDRAFTILHERKNRPHQWGRVNESSKWNFQHAKWQSYRHLIQNYLSLL
jgi:hypothetical protein